MSDNNVHVVCDEDMAEAVKCEVKAEHEAHAHVKADSDAEKQEEEVAVSSPSKRRRRPHIDIDEDNEALPKLKLPKLKTDEDQDQMKELMSSMASAVKTIKELGETVKEREAQHAKEIKELEAHPSSEPFVHIPHPSHILGDQLWSPNDYGAEASDVAITAARDDRPGWWWCLRSAHSSQSTLLLREPPNATRFLAELELCEREEETETLLQNKRSYNDVKFAFSDDSKAEDDHKYLPASGGEDVAARAAALAAAVAEIENWKRPSDPLCPTQPVHKKARTCSTTVAPASQAEPIDADANVEPTDTQEGQSTETRTCYTPVMKTRHAVQPVCLLMNAIGLSMSNHRNEAELRKWLETSFPGLVLQTRKIKKKKGVHFAYNEHALYGLDGHEAVHRILVFVREQVALVGATLPEVPAADLFRTEGEYYAKLPDGKTLEVADDMRAKLTGVLGYDPKGLPSPLSAASIHEWWSTRGTS